MKMLQQNLDEEVAESYWFSARVSALEPDPVVMKRGYLLYRLHLFSESQRGRSRSGSTLFHGRQISKTQHLVERVRRLAARFNLSVVRHVCSGPYTFSQKVSSTLMRAFDSQLHIMLMLASPY